jgi:colanic acid biosynthesis glycosyl transferase WcaI
VKLAVVTPHFTPDSAPTGIFVTRIVEELTQRGHRIEVITALPWYREHRIEPGFEGRLTRTEDTPWGRIVRVHPFPAADKRDIFRRAIAFAGFSLIASAAGARGGSVDSVLAVSPPLTLGLTGLAVARARKAPLVFNIQDVYPDVAIELGALESKVLIGAARRLEAFCYNHADATTVLTEDLRDNVRTKASHPERVHVIPNFVDTTFVQPMEKENTYRRQFDLGGKRVVMYAGNIGLSQSLDIVLECASALAYEEDLVFVINGQGAVRGELERHARGLPNVRFVDMQPPERLPEVLAAADIHLVPLRKGLARSSMPSKTYSILAAARPLVASVDAGSEVTRVIERSGAGMAVPPEDAEALTKAVRSLLDAPDEMHRMGEAGRAWVESWASPAAVAESYERLFEQLQSERGRPRPP